MKERLIPTHRLRLALLALALATGVCLGMMLARALFVHHLDLRGYEQMEFRGFVWNLFLAWIPLFVALRIHAISARPAPSVGTLTALGITWLLFFPNAPYIVTDLVHLKNLAPVPKWFDLLMIMSFAWTGLLLGYLSLYLVQELVRRASGRGWSWCFVALVLALSSFGIYLGRFQRFNSWDVVTRPMGLLSDMAQSVDFSRSHEPLAFSITFFAFSFFSYLTLFALTHLHGLAEPAPLSVAPSPLPPAENV